MKCVVTGAAGFIGSHLCTKLLDDGHEVIGIDDLSTGRMENLEQAEKYQGFSFIQVSIVKDHNSPEYDILKGSCDWMFHLAAKADVVPSIERPNLYHDVNVTGTLNMLQLARTLNVKRFIYAASSSCYGIPTAYPTSENAVKKPMYPYALTKYLGEQYVMHWAKVFGLQALSLRLFNVYGPNAKTSGAYGAVFGVFLSQLANNKPFTVVGDGLQRRDFTHVSDVVRAFITAAGSDYSNQIYNVGTGAAYSIRDLIRNILGGGIVVLPIVYLPDRPGEPRKTQAKITKISMELGWEAKVDFPTGCMLMRDIVGEFKDAPLWDKEKIALATKTWFKYLGHE